jgi:hypothetical protein
MSALANASVANMLKAAAESINPPPDRAVAVFLTQRDVNDLRAHVAKERDGSTKSASVAEVGQYVFASLPVYVVQGLMLSVVLRADGTATPVSGV